MKFNKRNIFEELKGQSGCSKHLSCVSSEVRNQCDINNKTAHESLDCLECNLGSCEFIKTFGPRKVCSCPLRNYIVKNFDGFIIDSADRIKRRNC